MEIVDFKSKRGFTLLEMLVVVSIFILIAVVGSGIFFSVLKGSSKTNITNLVKQEGSFALSVMERMIRNSRGIVGNCTSSMNEITILNPDDNQTTFVCQGPVDSEISSNSASLVSDLVKVDSCSINCTSGQGIRPDLVEISLTLSQKQDAGALGKEDIAQVSFNKKITLRNID